MSTKKKLNDYRVWVIRKTYGCIAVKALSEEEAIQKAMQDTSKFIYDDEDFEVEYVEDAHDMSWSWTLRDDE
jgi:hypothetical protein